MEKNLLLCGSSIAVAVLVLASLSPVVGYKTLESEDEFVEFDVEFCGLGKKHTVQLTQSEAEELDILFDSINIRLDKAETREETDKIFNEAITKLDRYGILGDLTIKETQRLVTGRFHKSKGIAIFEKFMIKMNRVANFNFSNLFCIVFASIRDNRMLSIEGNIFFILGVALDMIGFEQIGERLMNYGWKKPIRILNSINLQNLDSSEAISVYSIGLLGFKTHIISPETDFNIYGFTGIIIKPDFENIYQEIYSMFFLGSAIATFGYKF